MGDAPTTERAPLARLLSDAHMDLELTLRRMSILPFQVGSF
jgi:hypothetical protein